LHARARLLPDLGWRCLKDRSRAHAELTPFGRCDSLRHRPIEAYLALRAHTDIAQTRVKNSGVFAGMRSAPPATLQEAAAAAPSYFAGMTLLTPAR
jgi:hypothetical protein